MPRKRKSGSERMDPDEPVRPGCCMATPGRQRSRSTSSTNSNRMHKIDQSLLPFSLTKGHSPGDLRKRKKLFSVFYQSIRLANKDVSVQQAFFTKAMDSSLVHAVMAGMDESTPIYGDGSLMEKLEVEFRVLYPTFTRRMKLINLQQDGENARDYLQRIKRVSLKADFHS